MHITKMHGLGNDFIVIDGRQGAPANWGALAARLCARRLSVGADGLIVLEASTLADVRMRIFNADGSEAEMCGNGIRCFARYAYDRGAVHSERFSVETLAGVMRPSLLLIEGEVSGVRVDMGCPSWEKPAIPMVGEGSALGQALEVAGRKVTVHAVLMGVPHAVVEIAGDVTWQDFDTLGPALEAHPAFPRKTNVDFVEVLSRETVRVKTWERGAGPTLACGTGSCAVACVLHRLGRTNAQLEVALAAGSLHIEVGERVYMTGPAAYVFEGEV